MDELAQPEAGAPAASDGDKSDWKPRLSSEDIECTECICGYSCGTSAALHRHLDKNPIRSQHAAKSAFPARGKQWLARGSVRERSALFEERIQSVSANSANTLSSEMPRRQSVA